MRKVLWSNFFAVLMAAGLLLSGLSSAHAAWNKIDDFQSYSPGLVSALTGTNWATGGNNTTSSSQDAIVMDGASNKVLAKSLPPTAKGFMSWSRLTLGSTQQIAEGQTGTFFLRFLPTSNTLNMAFGLSDVDAIATWADFRVNLLLITTSGFQVRNGSAFATIAPFTPNTWYDLWLVVDNAADTYKIYWKPSSTAGATAANLVSISGKTDIPLRAAVTTALDRFAIFGDGNTGSKETKVWFDDLYITEGTDLSNPLNVGPAPNAIKTSQWQLME